MENFCQAVVELGSTSDAYRKTYSVANMKDSTVNKKAYQLMSTEKIRARIGALQNAAAKLVIGDKAAVLQEWWDIATADNNELSSYRRVCCRYCYGKDHKYQWADKEEFLRTTAEIMDGNNRRKKPDALPVDDGGYGYAKNASPHAFCPKCRGEGEGEAFFADTTKLKGKARKLYAGVEKTKDGLKIKTRDQDKALEQFAKLAGMTVPQVVQLTGAGGGALASVVTVLPTDPQEAARFYQEFMKAAQ